MPGESAQVFARKLMEDRYRGTAEEAYQYGYQFSIPEEVNNDFAD